MAPSKVIDVGEPRETYRSSGGGFSEESVTLLIEHDAEAAPKNQEVMRLAEPWLADGNGYVGRILSVYLVAPKVKVFGLLPGREVSQFDVIVEKEW